MQLLALTGEEGEDESFASLPDSARKVVLEVSPSPFPLPLLRTVRREREPLSESVEEHREKTKKIPRKKLDTSYSSH